MGIGARCRNNLIRIFDRLVWITNWILFHFPLLHVLYPKSSGKGPVSVRKKKKKERKGKWKGEEKCVQTSLESQERQSRGATSGSVRKIGWLWTKSISQKTGSQKYCGARVRGGQNPREPVTVLPRQSSPSRRQWPSRSAHLQNHLRILKTKTLVQDRANVF